MRKWKVSSNPMVGYQVYRVIDPSKVDHAGNREWSGRVFRTEGEAAAEAERLNRKEATA